MKPYRVLVLVWLAGGFGAVAGSILGNAFGQRGLHLGAVVGGLLGAAGAVFLAARLAWLPRTERAGAAAGAVVGFLIAAPIAVHNLHTPITPLLLSALPGVGALIGAGLQRGGRRP